MNIKHPSPTAILSTLFALVSVTACEADGWSEQLELLDATQLQDDNLELDVAGPPAQPMSLGDSRKGRIAFGAWPGDGTLCQDVTFTAFPNKDTMRVQVGIDHEGSAQVNRDATTVWVEEIETDSIRVCVRETDDYDDNHLSGLNVTYRVYDWTNVDPLETVTGSTTGNIVLDGQSETCTNIKYATRADQASPRTFASPPILQLSITHPDDGANATRDAMTIWAKNVTKSSFTACVQETGHDDHNPGNGHTDYQIDWIAFDQGAIGVDGVYDAAASSGRTCDTISFTDGDPNANFSAAPLLFLTIDDDGVVDDAITAWVEDVDADEFELCYRELAAGDDSHTAMQIRWVALAP